MAVNYKFAVQSIDENSAIPVLRVGTYPTQKMAEFMRGNYEIVYRPRKFEVVEVK